jgi:hypothetical protein
MVVVITILDVVDLTTMKKIHISLMSSLPSSTPCDDIISISISHSFLPTRCSMDMKRQINMCLILLDFFQFG